MTEDDDGRVLALGPCVICGELFVFDVDRVTSVPIDPENGLPPDLGGDAERAVRRPVCPDCMDDVNKARVEKGLPAWPTGRVEE